MLAEFYKTLDSPEELGANILIPDLGSVLYICENGELFCYMGIVSRELASKLGIVKGYEDGSFHAIATVSRAEFATMLVKALGLVSTASSDFKDTESHWATEAKLVLQDKSQYS